MESQQWLDQYAQLALQLDQIFQRTIDERFVESVYGRYTHDKFTVQPAPESSTLLQQAGLLGDTLAEQAFAPQRARFLSKQVVALEAVCRRLCGEVLPITAEVQRYFDVQVGWIDEQEFDDALATYDAKLPGRGSRAERLRTWHTRHITLPTDLPTRQRLLRLICDELCARTQRLIVLPSDEHVSLSVFDDHNYSGTAQYRGGYHSEVAIHTKVLHNLHILVENLCHEAYPGHHVESCIKERDLYDGKGHHEQALWLQFTPQGFISEAIAQYALEMVFAPDELEQWLAEDIYSAFDLNVAPVDAAAILRARDVLEGVWCNASFLVRERRADAEIAPYLMRYGLPPDVTFLKTPFLDVVMFCYVFSKRLLRPAMQSSQARMTFRQMLQEQCVPSDVIR